MKLNFKMLRLLLLLSLAVSGHCETCQTLEDYLVILERYPQILGTEAAGQALDAHPSATREDTSLEMCEVADTCCSKHSEGIIRNASLELFQTYSTSMAMSALEDELKTLESDVIDDVLEVTTEADGAKAGDAARRYVEDNKVGMEDVTKYSLQNFVSSVYGRNWKPPCFKPLLASQALMSTRVYTVLNQYKVTILGIKDGINKIPKLKVVATEELSDECKVALVKSGIYDLGCKMCSDATSDIVTCFDLCINVARGCLRPLLCHTGAWAAWAARQDALNKNLVKLTSTRGDFIDGLLDAFEADYSVAVTLEENDWMLTKCRIDLNNRNKDNLDGLKQKEIHLPSITKNLLSQQFGNRLLNLPTQACVESSFVSDDQFDVNCWNGTHVGAYIHPAAFYTLEEQKCNAEMTLPDRLSCDDEDRDMTCSPYETEPTETEPTEIDPTGPVEGEKIIERKPNSATSAAASVYMLAYSVYLVVR